MRVYQKKQCLETLRLIEEAQQEVVKYIEKSRTDEALGLLAQCQQGAVSVGEAVEKTEGEGTETVRLLEKYCEELFRIYDSIANHDTSVSYSSEIKKLRKMLQQSENEITHQIPEQKEVVFLPYKASMWDSLETVWKKADADPDITAIVMPIPYFDKNPDGSFREMHYEIDKFPGDVPVVRYEAYDLAAHHPDEIYIHNPYDQYNHVTSVHPNYYSDKLMDYTDMLIYIPYFVLGDIDPDNEKAVDGIEHFVTVPGVVNADKVVVQDENYRKAYIKILTKMYREGGNTERAKASYWEPRIKAEGSPKIERVRNLKAEDFVLPGDWNRLLLKEDGSKKKMIFYNTSIAALLKYQEKMIRKMKDNFRIFHENADEIVLLWRPHPLIEATLTSMRPQLWEEYKALRDEYRKEGWGIYDDSPDLDRAIAVSDAYYGDHSSVVWLYRETKKPIMIQNCEVLDEEEKDEV